MASWPALVRAQPFDHLTRQARLRPSSVALVSPERTLSFAELHRHAARLAALLGRRGVKAGELVVTELAPDLGVVFMEALFNLAAIGCTFPGTVRGDNPAGFDWLVAYATSGTFAAERTIVVDEELLAEAARSPELAPAVYDSEDAPCRLVFSSGTTGAPAGVPYSIRMLEGRATLGERNWMQHRPFMSLIPIASAIGLVTAYANLAAGESYLCPGTALDNLRTVRENFVATVKGSPAQLAELAAATRDAGVRLDEVISLACVGSQPTPALFEALEAVCDAPLRNFYGSTEVGSTATGDARASLGGEMGDVLEGIEVEIVDDDDRPVPAGESGIIRSRSTYQATAYWRDEAATRSNLRGGWFYPGDLGMLRDGRRLFLAGRSVELLNAGGVKLNPVWVDVEVRRVEGVLDGAAFSVGGDGGAAEIAIAVVVPDGLDLDSLTVPFAAACQGVRPAYVIRVAEIPRNTMGKVNRVDLARRLQVLLAPRSEGGT